MTVEHGAAEKRRGAGRRGEAQSSHPHSRGGATWLGEELQWARARARQRHSAVGVTVDDNDRMVVEPSMIMTEGGNNYS